MSQPLPPTPSTSKRTFARHFAEMVAVMLLGMGVLEGLAALAFAAAGSSLTDQSWTFRVMLMGLSMTGPMVLWMTYRGHSAWRNIEMAASMLIPSGGAAALAGAGVGCRRGARPPARGHGSGDARRDGVALRRVRPTACAIAVEAAHEVLEGHSRMSCASMRPSRRPARQPLAPAPTTDANPLLATSPDRCVIVGATIAAGPLLAV